MMKKAVKKADSRFICPHFACGVVSAYELGKLAELIRETPGCKVKISGNLIIGLDDADRRKSFLRKLKLRQSSVAGLSIRPVKICSGDYICSNNLQNILPLGMDIDRRFHGQETPFKLIISISGCSRCCSEPKVSDIGIVAGRSGFSIYAGGSAGANPRIGRFLAGKVKSDDVKTIVNNIVETYKARGRTPKRLGLMIDEMGFEAFKKRVLV